MLGKSEVGGWRAEGGGPRRTASVRPSTSVTLPTDGWKLSPVMVIVIAGWLSPERIFSSTFAASRSGALSDADAANDALEQPTSQQRPVTRSNRRHLSSGSGQAAAKQWPSSGSAVRACQRYRDSGALIAKIVHAVREAARTLALERLRTHIATRTVKRNDPETPVVRRHSGKHK